MTTKRTTWAAQIAVLLVLLATGTTPASSGLLAANSPRGKNSLEGGFHQGSAAVSGEPHRGWGEVCAGCAADSVVAPRSGAAVLGTGDSAWVVRNASNAAEIDAAINAAANRLKQGGTVFIGEADAALAVRGSLVRPQPGFRDIIVHAHTNIGPGEPLPTFFINTKQGMVPVTTKQLANVIKSLNLPEGQGIRLISCGGGSCGMEGVNLASDLAKATGRRIMANDAPIWLKPTGELKPIEPIKGWQIVKPDGTIEPLVVKP